MKKPFLIILLLSISILTGTVSCKKYQPPKPDNPYGLPDATQSGQDIFACLVNGKPWIAMYGIPPYGGPWGEYSGNSLWVTGGQETENEAVDISLNIMLPLSSIKANTSYNLSDTTISWGKMEGYGDSCFADTGGGYGGGTFLKYTTKGELTITRLDTVKHIFSGTFWFDIPTDYCDTLEITYGRFDIVF